MTHLILLFILAVLLVSGCPAQQRGVEITSSARERRVALVIGNSAYTNVPSLRNPANDARDMAAALSEVGFKVTSGIDITRREMKHLIREFGQSLKSGGSGLFYYAGHGVQSKGHNYLIPVDAEIETEAEIEDAGVDLNLVLNSMDEAENGLNIVILDACRNNPFARGFRSTSGGLAQVDAPTGTLIAYATAPGKVARDGDGRNGVYTEELLKQIRVPGLTIEDLLKRVRTNLKQRTKGEQVPWESSSLVGNFYFALPNNAVSNSKPDIPNSVPTAETGPRQFLLTAVDANLPVQKLETRTKILERRTESNALTTGTLRYNVTNYRIEAQLMISQQFLLAAADITFVPIEASRAFFFELNGSLDVESVERNGKLLTGTTQDRVGGGPLGPNIRVDLNEVVPASEPITLRFRWHGPLVSAVGGPLALKRLAY